MSERKSIYVIYRPLPATLLTLVLAAIGALAGLLAGTAAATALAQRDPGPAVWDTSDTATLTGTIIADPYPMLLPADGSPGVLLVGVGKVGPPEEVVAMAGSAANVTGYTLERNGMRMLEVQSAEAAQDSPPRAPTIPIDHGTHAIATEILDSKCYLGAMKPGDGIGHKACATLCITGGIPPMMSWTDNAGKTHYALLTNADGSPMPERHRPLIAEPVTIEGRLTARDGWLWMAISGVSE